MCKILLLHFIDSSSSTRNILTYRNTFIKPNSTVHRITLTKIFRLTIRYILRNMIRVATATYCSAATGARQSAGKVLK